MASKKTIRIFYRAAAHVPLWKVMEEGGFLEKHGLKMQFGSMEGLRRKAMERLREGELDIISGNHHNLYARRALRGEPFVHIAQPNNVWGSHWMVAAQGIQKVEDLRGKRVLIDDFDSHPGLNVWLYLRLRGLEGERDVGLVNGGGKSADCVRRVMAGEYDATFVGAVDQMRARAAGATVSEVSTMPMIEGVTITTTTTFVNGHEDEVRGLLRALVDTIHFYKIRRQESLEIINRTCRDLLRLQSDEELATFYEHQSKTLGRKPYPTLDAIQNVFALALKTSPEIQDFNPLAMWDLHYLRELDDSGYIDRLYA
ncbi:MAG: ABC transporter substrate-binding protein [Candidatus Binatia bacterium]